MVPNLIIGYIVICIILSIFYKNKHIAVTTSIIVLAIGGIIGAFTGILEIIFISAIVIKLILTTIVISIKLN